jgi:hypothetical protein
MGAFMNTSQPENKNAAGRIVFLTIILCIGYAILRYHILGPVGWKDFPFLILNKGISLAALVLLVLNFSLGPLNNIGVPVPDSWLSPSGWHGGLPPISLVAFVFFMTGYVVNLFGRK